MRMTKHARRIATSIALTGVVACLNSFAQQSTRKFQFEQFPVEVYTGKMHIAARYHLEKDGVWRDRLNKWMATPEVTFAGAYFLSAHSCGAMCRYFEIVDVRNGKELSIMDRFAAAEEPPKTPDGHPYWTNLYARSGSRLLIAEYHLDMDDSNKQETCRQQYFVFKNRRLTQISEVFPFCTEEPPRPTIGG